MEGILAAFSFSYLLASKGVVRVSNPVEVAALVALSPLDIDTRNLPVWR